MVIMEVMGPGSPIAMIVVNRLGPVQSERALGAARRETPTKPIRETGDVRPVMSTPGNRRAGVAWGVARRFAGMLAAGSRQAPG